MNPLARSCALRQAQDAPPRASRAQPRGRCIALRHSAEYDELWMPCARRSGPDSQLCREHLDAAIGIVLGFDGIPEALEWFKTFAASGRVKNLR